MYVKPELYSSAPAEERHPREMAVYALLDELGIPYTRCDHDHADTMEDCLLIERTLGARICKNLFLCNRQKTKFYLLLMPGSKPFKTKDLSAQIGSSRLSFGGPEDMERLLHLTPGSVTVLGLMYDPDCQVTLLIDQDLYQQTAFGCHPCINTSTVQFSTADLREKLLPALGHPVTLVQL